tara:strand:+ start:5321 stop:5605 length:285 start_codon:yes stop_codon:yes gene_type:complete
MTSPIVTLDSGVTVVLADPRGGDWWRGIIIHSLNPAYPVGSSDIGIGPEAIARGRNIILPDDVMETLAATAEVRGPEPTVADVIRSLTSNGEDA